MKKLLGIMVLGLLLSGCSENKSKITKLVETCSDNMLYEKFDKAFKSEAVGLYKVAEPEIKSIIENDLNSKLNKYNNFVYKKKNKYGSGATRLRFEEYFNKCETDQKLHPIKFKEKYTNHKIPYQNYNF